MFTAGGAAAGGSVGGIFFIVILVVVAFTIYKKKQADKDANPFLSGRKNKDEVWQTIKRFLKDNGEQGKEIVDSFVVKRDHIDTNNPNNSELERLNKASEIKIRSWQDKKAKAEAKASGTIAPERPRPRDLFVVVFKTRDTKTHTEDPTRCFECEVVNTKIGKSKYDRKILVHGELNLDKEMEWIAPIRSAELAKQKAIDAKIAKQKEQEAKAEKRRRERVERRAQKHAKK